MFLRQIHLILTIAELKPPEISGRECQKLHSIPDEEDGGIEPDLLPAPIRGSAMRPDPR